VDQVNKSGRPIQENSTMRAAIEVYIALSVGITLGATVPTSASAQVPSVESPTMAVPARGAVIKAAAPAQAAAPAEQPPEQPTTPPAGEPAPVSPAPAPSGVILLSPAAAPTATGSSSQAASKARSYVSGRSALMLEGGVVGWLKATEGGGISADVVAEGQSAGGAPKKHIGKPEFDDISLQVGWEAAKPLLDWVAASWRGGPQPKNGKVSFTDFDYKERSAREFTNAVVSATTFPTLDVGSKDPIYLTVKLAPETIRLISGSGAQVTSPSASHQKTWMPANFRLELPGLDVSKVARIESFTIGQHVTEDAVGESRIPAKEAGGIEFPNLKIAISEATAQTWVDWSEDFIVKGNNGEEKEKNGAIVFLDPSLKNELGRVNLFNCGIAGLAPERQVANAETIRKLIAELYCERMELVPGK
jgi:hypothetical protein